MFRTTCTRWISGALLMVASAANPQVQTQTQRLSVDGHSGDVAIVRQNGHVFVDIEDLARVTGGSITSENDRIIFTLPRESSEQSEPTPSGFSPEFRKAAIEAMASMREWAGIAMITVQNGYPVENNMAGNTMVALQDHAAERIALASVAASTESDKQGLELLRTEFDNAKAWSDRFIQARSSLSAANMTMTEGSFKDDEDAQKIIRCGRFLAQMFAGDKFQDDVACH